MGSEGIGIDMMKITIDEKEIDVLEGQSILEAALANNIYIPHLCYHPDLEAKGGCRLCSVEIEGLQGAVPSCMTKVEDGMVVHINGPEADKIRNASMELILATHTPDCTGCPKFGKCELQSMYQYFGVSPERWRKKVRGFGSDDSNPMISHMFTRCIRCGRCIRACQDLRGVNVLDYVKTPQGIRAGIREGANLEEAGCRFCGACIEVCPTGSIVDQLKLMKQERTYAENVVPCKAACPAHIDIPRFIRYLKNGEYEKASAVVHEKVPFPEILGAVCVHPCEAGCKRNELGSPVSICKLKRAAAQHDETWKQGRRPCEATGKKVAVIGAGPAGLTAAYYLNNKGHAVTVYEKNEKAGGQCRYGIPAYRLPDELLDREINSVLATGITLKTNCAVKEPRELLNAYDAVLVSVGTHKGTILPIEGHDLENVHVNADFLKKARQGDPCQVGERVMVLGGGNVAYDCARTAIRLGAKEVHMACLEAREAMTATDEEIEEGEKEGIILHDAHSFPRIVGQTCVEGVEIVKVKKFYFDENHKAVTELDETTRRIIPVDTVIFAVGQKPEGTDAMGLELTHGPYIKANDRLETSIAGIYAAGDVVTGTKSVIEAIVAGRNAAQQMDRYLGGDGDIEETLIPYEKPLHHIGRIENFTKLPRIEPDCLPTEASVKSFAQTQKVFTCDQAQCEAGRCLQCDLRLSITKPKLWNEY